MVLASLLIVMLFYLSACRRVALIRKGPVRRGLWLRLFALD
ncbi:hypothetical protein [Pseudogemmobacter bohemicus]|nr:hypothetical protein [Pseudogemmobacter bohemicus]